jgi:pyruvate dehydrogenase E1 component
VDNVGTPTVILAKTVKGYGMGEAGEGQNITHQQKKMGENVLRAFRDRFGIDLPDERIAEVPFLRLTEGGREQAYLRERREALGGALPTRRPTSDPLPVPELSAFAAQLKPTGDREISTTMAFVRILTTLLRDKQIGKRVVPIVPDESRTFGMEGMFRQFGIFSQVGQLYQPEDAKQLMYYREDKNGQILQEGINEPGAMSSWIAAATSYSTSNTPMIPFYVYYSMFGFQRVGDLAWAAGDMRARGFLLGGTAGRTTLNGEGLQHEDGHSLLLAHTNPAVVCYDPAFSYEVGHITKDALARMYGDDPGAPLGGSRSPDVMYYLTIYNEPYRQPAEPEGLDLQGLLAGMYLYAPGPSLEGSPPKAQVLASGVAVPWALRAQELLANDWGVSADVWSVTSWNELRRQADAAEEHNLLHPEEDPQVPYVTQRLADAPGPVVAVSDWMRAVPDLIAPYVPGGMATLGTDGFGLSDTRPALRRHFHVDAESVVVRVLASLAQRGEVDRDVVRQAVEKYQIRDVQAAPAEERSDPSPAT